MKAISRIPLEIANTMDRYNVGLGQASFDGGSVFSIVTNTIIYDKMSIL